MQIYRKTLSSLRSRRVHTGYIRAHTELLTTFWPTDHAAYLKRFSDETRGRCKILDFHGLDYEECRLLGCDAVLVLLEPTFQRNELSLESIS
jgi:hypothetical protein